ncbi:hypothetical protein THAOC_09590 [Thalassiosira oceanica]|uniref:Uncharacterized protein n=1 Tax=Thalassiosira oceanica TaxID=159749 RepID=K0SW75_THAOC|nr:hypothetical protein THAOC_09590 [Thalassiosira oceanica]|eukprot:EJK69184.1 hypothetical protein THAOC_09590 [Thalassiosira oceanica]
MHGMYVGRTLSRDHGMQDPGGDGGVTTLLRPPRRSVLWTTDALRFGLIHPIASSYNSACSQAGALGPISGRPFTPLNVRDMMVMGNGGRTLLAQGFRDHTTTGVWSLI